MPSGQMAASVPDRVVKVRFGDRWRGHALSVEGEKRNGRNNEEDRKDNELPRMREQQPRRRL